jgi:hypothetical protein
MRELISLNFKPPINVTDMNIYTGQRRSMETSSLEVKERE